MHSRRAFFHFKWRGGLQLEFRSRCGPAASRAGKGEQDNKEEEEKKEGEEGEEEGGEEGEAGEGEGVAPLLKSRDPHLAGGETCLQIRKYYEHIYIYNICIYIYILCIYIYIYIMYVYITYIRVNQHL